MTGEDDVTVTDDVEGQRYVLTVGGVVAGGLVYRPLPAAPTTTTRVFVHTEVDDAFGGRGLGSRLVAAALDDARSTGVAVLPQCPFVKAWLGKHPEELDVVPAADRAAYGLPPA